MIFYQIKIKYSENHDISEIYKYYSSVGVNYNVGHVLYFDRKYKVYKFIYKYLIARRISWSGLEVATPYAEKVIDDLKRIMF